jgi:hypothetical protein
MSGPGLFEDVVDRQTKSTQWGFTAYEGQWELFNQMPPGIAEWGWQREICPNSNRPHNQGYLRLTQQQRFAWLAKILPGVHIFKARNWQALINYCKKTDTAVPGTQVHQKSQIQTHFQYAEDLAKRIYAIHEKTGILDDWTNATAMDEINGFARLDIRDGKRYVAWIISNPQWAAMWRPYWKDFILSFRLKPAPIEPNQESGESPLAERGDR